MSATSSTPQRNPRPRTSATLGWSLRAACRLLPEKSTDLLDAFHQALGFQDAHGGQPGGGGDRVVREGAAVNKGLAAVANRIEMGAPDPHGREGHCPARKPFAEGYDVGRHVVVLAGKPAAGASHAAQDLIQNQQHLVTVADVANDCKILRRRGTGRQSAAGDRFRQKGRHGLRSEVLNGFLQRQGAADPAVGVGEAVGAPQAVDRGDVDDVCEQGGIGGPEGGAARGRQGAQRQSVVGFPAGDQTKALRTAGFEVDLAGELDGGLHGFGAAGDEVKAIQSLRCVRGQGRGQLLHHRRGEHGGMHVMMGEDLVAHGVGNFPAAVTQVDDDGAAAGIQEAPAGIVFYPDPLGLDGHGKGPV